MLGPVSLQVSSVIIGKSINSMKNYLPAVAGGFALGLLLLCSCATSPERSALAPAASLPADVPINPDAGRGNELFLPLQLADGETLTFLVDTGSPVTLFDRSLEPRLGKRLGTMAMWNFGTEQQSGVYAAPRLYLQDIPLLMSGTNVETIDLRDLSAKAGVSIMGILGMDCLSHYCLQLDFTAGRIRFLDPDRLDPAPLGQSFPLIFNEDIQSRWGFIRPWIAQPGLVGGGTGPLLVDTGYRNDGALDSGAFHREVRNRRSPGAGDAVLSQDSGRVWFAGCVWHGGTYTNLLVGEGGTLIGLRFLARHLVTFNFPKQTIYLKPTSVGPLISPEMASAWNYVMQLKTAGRLPGWSSTDSGTLYLEANSSFQAFDGRKLGDPSLWHFSVVRASPTEPWHLQKAWQTDPSGHTLKEYPVALRY